MAELVISVRGTRPIPWGSNEWKWRATLAKAARETCAKSVLAAPGGDAQFFVDIVFSLTAMSIINQNMLE
jgi:hypothetical protein